MTGIVVCQNSLRIHTHQQTGEVVTHLAFYAGWPNAFSALPVVKDVSRNARTRTSNGCRSPITPSRSPVCCKIHA